MSIQETATEHVTVADLMTTDVVVVDYQDPVGDVRTELAASGLHAVPVVADGDIVGVLTLADCHDAFGFELAADAITSPPITVEAAAPVKAAARIMRDQHIHHLPATDDKGKLVGILSSFDLLRLLVE